MLILLGTEGNNLESQLAKRFGHAGYYILYDTVSKNYEAFSNNAEEHNHDDLIKFLERGTQAFIVGNIGPHAFEIVNTPNSSVYLARKMSAAEAIKKFEAGELQKLTEPTAKKSIGHGEHHG